MAEWHLAPEYIIGNWTDEELDLMCEKLAKRKEAEAKAWEGEPKAGDLRGRSDTVVSDSDLFRMAGNLIEVRDERNK